MYKAEEVSDRVGREGRVGCMWGGAARLHWLHISLFTPFPSRTSRGLPQLLGCLVRKPLLQRVTAKSRCLWM